MSIYGHKREVSDERAHKADGAGRAGYRPGWSWIPVGVTLLLIILVIISGLIYGGYRDRGIDSEELSGATVMPTLATPVATPAPPLAGDGQ